MGGSTSYFVRRSKGEPTKDSDCDEACYYGAKLGEVERFRRVLDTFERYIKWSSLKTRMFVTAGATAPGSGTCDSVSTR